MLGPDYKLFRCEIWEEEAGDGKGGLFAEFRWGKSREEIEGIFELSKGEKLYKCEEVAPEIAEAWQSGYDEGVMIGIVGERLKGNADGTAVQDMFNKIRSEQEELDNGKQ